jgi:CRP-like cAMP-binding protein
MSEDKALRRARAKLIKALEENRELEAIELLAELRRFEPDNARWPHKQGELLKQLGHHAQAAQVFEKAVGLYAKQGFIARAVAMAKTVVELDPSRISVLERIDPQAAQLLRTHKKMSRQARVDLDDRPVEQLPIGTPARGTGPQLRPGLPAPPPVPAPAPAPPPVPRPQQRHDLVGLSLPPMAAAPRPVVSQRPARGPEGLSYQKISPDGARSMAPGRAAPPPPGAARSLAPGRNERAAPPPPPAAAMQVQAMPAVTLDRLSLPPMNRRPRALVPHAPVSLDHLYSRAVRAVPLLAPDEAAPADETRFSDRPEPSSERALAEQLLARSAHTPPVSRADTETDVAMALASLDSDEPLGGALTLSEVEVAERVPVPVLESQRPEPPTAATLADLPLFPLFAALPQPVLARIVAGSELIELADGAYVSRKDDDGDALYGIVEGSVNLTVPGQDFELTLAEGDVFGETCLLEEAKSQLDVLVMGQLTALRIPRAVLLRGIEEHPPLAGLVLALLTRRLLGNLLQVSSLFQDFDAAGKAELARLFEVRRVAAGTQLSVSGKKMDGLYISLSGTLIVEQNGAPAWSAQPGSMFGQNCLLSHTPSGVDVSTAVDMIVLRLPAARFAGLALQHPTVLERSRPAMWFASCFEHDAVRTHGRRAGAPGRDRRLHRSGVRRHPDRLPLRQRRPSAHQRAGISARERVSGRPARV